MRRLIYLLIFVILSVAAIAVVNTEYKTDKASSIKISITMQEPNPAAPGEVVEVTFKLQNDGKVTNDVEFEILPEYPFRLFGDSAVRKIGTLSGTQNEKYAELIEYKLMVDSDAPDGKHEIKVRYRSRDSQEWATIKGLKITVQTSNAILNIDKFFTTPQTTPPGEKTKLRIELKNYATSLLKDIRLKLDLNNLPINPIGLSNELVISNIEPGGKKTVDFNLLVDSDAESKAYKIPLRIEYADVLNKNYSKNNLVTLVVGAEPDLSVTLESTDAYTSGKRTVSLRITNKGVSDIKLLSAKLKESDEYRILSSENVYVGNIDSDDYETADFELFIEKTEKDEVGLPLLIEYKDANNQDYSINYEIKTKVYSKNEAKRLGLIKNGNGFWVVISLVLILVGIWFWRRKKIKK